MMKVEKIEKLIKKIDVIPRAHKHDKTLNDALAAQEKFKNQQSANIKPNIWRIIMKNPITKFAVTAVIIAAALYIVHDSGNSIDGPSLDSSQLPDQPQITQSPDSELIGPQLYTFDDGTTVSLDQGAKIAFYPDKNIRGFQHLAGKIKIDVPKGLGEFIVTTPIGKVKALGTIFEMDLVEGDAGNGANKIKLLAVEVEEGSVEVSNEQGSVIVKSSRQATVQKDSAPYDFTQDKNLPPGLVKRVQSMIDAIKSGDKQAWIKNYNIKALFDLAKGNIKFSDHRGWFSGMSDEDAQRFTESLGDIESMEQLTQLMVSDVNMSDSGKLYVRSVTLADNRKHAIAVCVKKAEHTHGYTPQWTYFDGDWWQTDD
jgi:hypothetical protein